MSDEEAAAAAAARKKWILFSIVTVLSLAADQASKIWARATLPVSPANCDVPYDIMSHKCMGVAKPVIDGYWDWRLSQNPGSAFGLFAGTSFARVRVVGCRHRRGDRHDLHAAQGPQRPEDPPLGRSHSSQAERSAT